MRASWSPPWGSALRTASNVPPFPCHVGSENCCAAAMRSPNLTRADRIGYVVGGIALIVWALRRPSWSRAGAAGMGGWFLYQAYTGSNPMFKPLGIRVNPSRRGSRRGDARRRGSDHHLAAARGGVRVFCAPARICRRWSTERRGHSARRSGRGARWRGLRGEKLSHFGSLDLSRCARRRGTIVGAGSSTPQAAVRSARHSRGSWAARRKRWSPTALRRARAMLETGEAPTPRAAERPALSPCARSAGTASTTCASRHVPDPKILNPRDAIVQDHLAPRSAAPTCTSTTASSRRWRRATSSATSSWARWSRSAPRSRT